jgi:hypothetical protein
VLLPNVVGIISSLVQLTLRRLYPARPDAFQKMSMPGEQKPRTKEMVEGPPGGHRGVILFDLWGSKGGELAVMVALSWRGVMARRAIRTLGRTLARQPNKRVGGLKQ